MDLVSGEQAMQSNTWKLFQS